jgi:hypothetical protein
MTFTRDLYPYLPDEAAGYLYFEEGFILKPDAEPRLR